MLQEGGRVRLASGFRAWVEEAVRSFPVREASLTWEMALISREHPLPHRDPADRFLAASALVHELTLLTVDERLRAARWLPTRSA
jgi:PIN domain nuclease of toxin-antitoxin system